MHACMRLWLQTLAMPLDLGILKFVHAPVAAGPGSANSEELIHT